MGQDSDKKQGKASGKEPAGEIQLGLNLGQLFKGLGGFLEQVNRLEREGKQEEHRSGKINLSGGGKAVYGVSVRLGLGGTPVVQSFGHVHEEETGEMAEPVREPLTDVFDEGDEVVVVAEVPGVDEKTITLAAQGDVLTVQAGAGDRRYAKELRLPAPVQTDSIQHTYRNGILEIRLTKRKGSA